MGELLHLVQRGGDPDWAGLQSAQSHPRCTKCNSPPINNQCTNHCIAAVRCSAVLIWALNGVDVLVLALSSICFLFAIQANISASSGLASPTQYCYNIADLIAIYNKTQSLYISQNAVHISTRFSTIQKVRTQYI